MTDLTKKPHPMNGPPLPVREKQLVDRAEEPAWTDFASTKTGYELQASTSKPIRFRHRQRGTDTWFEGIPPL